ncbi:hypothetical protein FRC12_015716, partial [Ceratobasidium sp. 428]
MATPQTTTMQVWKNRFPAVEFSLLEPNDPNGLEGTYIVQLKAGCDLKAHIDGLKSAASSMGPADIQIIYEFE